MPFKLKILLQYLSLRVMRIFGAKNIKRLQAYRWRKFQKTLLKSTFYRVLAQGNNVLEKYPIVDKQTFMLNFDTINTKQIKLKDAFELALNAEKSRDFSPMIGDVTVGLSSGTSGNRGIFLASEKERAQWVACVLDRIIGLSLQKRKVAFFLRANSNLYDSVKSSVLEFHFFDLLEPIAKHVEHLNQLQAHILVGQPSLLMRLSHEIQSGNLRIAPQKIISVAEVLYPEDKKILEKTFNQTIHQVYQCTEGLLASTCKNGVLHFHEDYLIIEKKYVDGSKTKFHPIITDLMRSSQPVVRYELNDIITEKTDCDCGLRSTAIEAIEGRSDDVFTFQNEKGEDIHIFPDYFRRAIITADEFVTDYVLTKRNETNLELYVDGNTASFGVCEASIQALLHKFEVRGCIITAVEKPTFEPGQKFRRIRNETTK